MCERGPFPKNYHSGAQRNPPLKIGVPVQKELAQNRWWNKGGKKEIIEGGFVNLWGKPTPSRKPF